VRAWIAGFYANLIIFDFGFLRFPEAFISGAQISVIRYMYQGVAYAIQAALMISCEWIL
jgi:hypothetical protein